MNALLLNIAWYSDLKHLFLVSQLFPIILSFFFTPASTDWTISSEQLVFVVSFFITFLYFFGSIRYLELASSHILSGRRRWVVNSVEGA